MSGELLHYLFRDGIALTDPNNPDNTHQQIRCFQGEDQRSGRTDTTSTALTFTLREIFSNDAIYNRLHEELKTMMPRASTVPSLTELEQLPYLSACLKEGLRISTPIRSRLPRVCPWSGWNYKKHYLPGGTIISSSPHLMDYNEAVFSSPRIFKPERWLSEDTAAVKLLEDGWAPFSKGARGCFGKNFALAELYIIIAILTRQSLNSDSSIPKF